MTNPKYVDERVFAIREAQKDTDHVDLGKIFRTKVLLRRRSRERASQSSFKFQNTGFNFYRHPPHPPTTFSKSEAH